MRSYWSSIAFLFRRNRSRLVLVVERDEGELALRHDGFVFAVALAGNRFGLEPQRGAALLQQVDIDAELVADGHRAGKLDRVRRDQQRLALRPARHERAACKSHLAHQPAAEHAAVGVGVGGHGGDTDHRLSAQVSIPSGFSTSFLNTFMSFAPSAPSMARWSKLPVALMTVAIWSESLTT